ncbi:hypothetical protein [Streptomyces cupreus]|uniref:Uncharacterized protein n=1 Tax=Streptomyces cupreus TaxID=2759956 RepID=A0A7X1J5V1_9ACTN|nr:hypothetical protein [Streptomyces cupreus]MBC2904130.1 hypothetical protein [Streptomyces cupreus]
MNTQTVRLDSLPEAAVMLLRAVHDALDVPLPGVTDADERAYATLLQLRTRDALVILAAVLNKGHDIAPAAESLYSWTAERPVSYTPWSEDGGSA